MMKKQIYKSRQHQQLRSVQDPYHVELYELHEGDTKDERIPGAGHGYGYFERMRARQAGFQRS
jgi:hypothetical protein